MLKDNVLKLAFAVAAVLIPAVLFTAWTTFTSLVQDYYNRERLSVYSVRMYNPDEDWRRSASTSLGLSIHALDEIIAESDVAHAAMFEVARDGLQDTLEQVDETPWDMAHVRLVNNTDRTIDNVDLAPSSQSLGWFGSKESVIYDDEWNKLEGSALQGYRSLRMQI